MKYLGVTLSTGNSVRCAFYQSPRERPRDPGEIRFPFAARAPYSRTNVEIRMRHRRAITVVRCARRAALCDGTRGQGRTNSVATSSRERERESECKCTTGVYSAIKRAELIQRRIRSKEAADDYSRERSGMKGTYPEPGGGEGAGSIA